MFHCLAWSEVIGPTLNEDITPVSEGIMAILNSHFFPQQDMSIVFAWVGSATILRARFNSPKLRQTAPAYIRPISLNAVPATNDNIMILPPGALTIRGLEELALEATSGVAMTERLTCVAGIMDRYTPPPIGDIYNVRFTGTTTLVVNTWTNVPLTFETQLPVGTYAVIGGELQTASGQAFRLTFDNQYWRPGLPCIPLLTSRIPYALMYGVLGEWGRFRTTNLPRCEVLANAASTTQEGYLEVVRVA